MPDLPGRPSLDHLRREARDLLRAAESGDTAAAGRIRAVSATQTLASAQLALAREYGFASWTRLKTEVQARTTDLARQADAFCEASIRDWTGRAVRMLAATPELAGYNFATAVILLLEAGADPRRYADDDGAPASAAYEAVQSGCSAELLDLLLAHGAEPDRPAREGRSPYTLAILEGRADLADLLRRYGAVDDSTDTDRFLAACQRADQGVVTELLAADPGLPARLSEAQQAAALIRAAETGHVAALTLMLDLGFGVGAHGGENGGTALHAAAYAGSADAARLLLHRGGDVNARDETWDSHPLVWAAIGSSEQPGLNPRPDWAGAVRALLEAGANAADVTLSPDEDHPPSPEVAALLRQATITGR